MRDVRMTVPVPLLGHYRRICGRCTFSEERHNEKTQSSKFKFLRHAYNIDSEEQINNDGFKAESSRGCQMRRSWKLGRQKSYNLRLLPKPASRRATVRHSLQLPKFGIALPNQNNARSVKVSGGRLLWGSSRGQNAFIKRGDTYLGKGLSMLNLIISAWLQGSFLGS